MGRIPNRQIPTVRFRCLTDGKRGSVDRAAGLGGAPAGRRAATSSGPPGAAGSVTAAAAAGAGAGIRPFSPCSGTGPRARGAPHRAMKPLWNRVQRGGDDGIK